MFWIVLLRLFSFKFRHFLSTVGFSNEDNCCQLQGIGKLIKERLSKGIFKVDYLTGNVAGNTDFVKFIANICETTSLFFYKSSSSKFWARLIHKCGLYMSLYGILLLLCWLVHFQIPPVQLLGLCTASCCFIWQCFVV